MATARNGSANRQIRQDRAGYGRRRWPVVEISGSESRNESYLPIANRQLSAVSRQFPAVTRPVAFASDSEPHDNY
jgi:hypothetical protein